MIQNVVNGTAGPGNFREIDYEAGHGIDLAAHFDFAAKAVAVDAAALVAGRHMRQKMGGLEVERFDDGGFHGGEK